MDESDGSPSGDRTPRNANIPVIDLNTQVVNLAPPEPSDAKRTSPLFRSIVERYKKVFKPIMKKKRITTANVTEKQPEQGASAVKASPLRKDQAVPLVTKVLKYPIKPESLSDGKRKMTKALAKRERERKRRYRRECKRKKELQTKNASSRSLLQKLTQYVVGPLRGKKVYTQSLVELISRVGTCPSAAGARSPLAAIIRHVTSSFVWRTPFSILLRYSAFTS